MRIVVRSFYIFGLLRPLTPAGPAGPHSPGVQDQLQRDHGWTRGWSMCENVHNIKHCVQRYKTLN